MGIECKMDELEFYLEDLKTKFLKINPNDYYLSYSGGKDSHFIYWFLKDWLKTNDFKMYEDFLQIKIVGINTYMEHKEILDRINKNCDIVLRPELKPFEIKEKYGSPCFSKWQDDMINRYQNGCRRPYLIERVTGIHKDTGEVVQGRFKLNKIAKEGVLNDTLHKISPRCCEFLKKRPARKYEKESGRKAILGVRGSESGLRKSQYTSCFTKDKKFTPLWDLPTSLLERIYNKYNIEIPYVYKYVSRTGCCACPYGSYYGDTEKELEIITPQQRKFICRYFKESYDVLGIDYQKYLDEEKKDWESEISKEK